MNSQAMTRLKPFVSAIRTPALLLAGAWTLHAKRSLASALIVLQSQHNPFHDFFCAPPSQHDCFLGLPTSLWSVPSAITLLLYFIGLLAFLQLKGVVAARAQARWDGWIALTALLLAAAPWLLIRVQGPTVRLLPLLGGLTAALWIYIILNAGLDIVERFVSRRAWVDRLMEWTFPVSDLVCFRWHQRRLGQHGGLLRFVPIAAYVAMLAALLVSQISLRRGNLHGVKLPLDVHDPRQVVTDEEGFWYSDTVATTAGLWRYEKRPDTSRPYQRALDLHTFAVRDGFLYFHDAFDHELLKVEASNRQVVWRVPMPERIGTVELSLRDGMIVVLGQQGYLAVLDLDGRKRAERTVSARIAHPQVLSEREAAYVSLSEPALHIMDASSAEEMTVPLPLPPGMLKVWPARQSERAIPLVTATDYDEQRQMLYIATLWGDLFRWDAAARRWHSPFRIAPGIRAMTIDSVHHLLFAYNHARGFIDILELGSGTHLTYAMAPVFGNSVNLATDTQSATLSVHGPGAISLPRFGGIYQYRYEPLTASASRTLPQ